MHYKKMYDDKEFLYAFDLDGREVTVQIASVKPGTIKGEQGRSSKKPMVSFVGKTKKLALNKVNGKTIASLYGTDADKWEGKWVTLFPTTTTFGPDTVECIRVKNIVPAAPASQQRGKKQAAQEQAPAETAEPEHDAETGEVASDA